MYAHHRIVELGHPYPGGNLFSLDSSGAIHVLYPPGKVNSEQWNVGEFTPQSTQDCQWIEPYLEENERLFDILLEDLLIVDGQIMQPTHGRRKIQPCALRILENE